MIYNIINDINFLSNDSSIIHTYNKSYEQINNGNESEYNEIDIIIKYAIYFLVKLII